MSLPINPVANRPAQPGRPTATAGTSETNGKVNAQAFAALMAQTSSDTVTVTLSHSAPEVTAQSPDYSSPIAFGGSFEAYLNDFFESLSEEEQELLRGQEEYFLRTAGKSEWDILNTVHKMKVFLATGSLDDTSSLLPGTFGIAPPGYDVHWDGPGTTPGIISMVPLGSSNPFEVSVDTDDIFDWLDELILQSTDRQQRLSSAGALTGAHAHLTNNVGWAKLLKSHLSSIFK